MTTHEPTKGHERHSGDDVEIIEFPGMAELYRRFVREVNEHHEPTANYER